MVSASDGSAFTSTVTVYVTGDAGTQAIGSVGSGICTHEGNGYHTYAPAQAETNYDLIAFTFIGTGAIPATLQVETLHDANVTQLLGTAWLTPGTAGTPDVNVKLISDDATAANNAEAFFDGTGYAGTNNVIPTVTTLTNAPSDSSGVTTLLSRLSALRAGYLDNLSAGAVALASSLSTLQTDVTTLLSRITSTLFSGITSLAQWLGLIAGKQTGNSTARTEIRATGAGSGTFDEASDSQEAIRDNMGTAQTGDSYAIVNSGTFGNSALNTDLDALLTRLTATRAGYLDNLSGGAVALASALVTLQTSVDDLPTNAELATALGTADDAVLAAIAALNNLSQANIRTALGMASANLDTQLADLPTNAELATALGTADDAVLAAIAALNNLSSAQAQTAAAAALNAYDPPTKAELDSAVAPLATTTNVSAVETKVDTLLGRITAALFSGITSMAQWLGALAGKQTPNSTAQTEINATGAGSGTYSALTDSQEAIRDRGDSDWGAGAVPSVGDIADAVWDEAISGHLTAGSTGAKLNSAASAGDPLSSEVPGSYAEGTAGFILGSLTVTVFTQDQPENEECIETVQLDVGEKKRIYARIRASTGTLTIQGTPTVQLLNRSGTQVYGIDGDNVTGSDAGALSSVRAWYDLDTASPPTGGPIVAGRYTLCFTITVLKSGGGTETRIIKTPIKVESLT